MIIKDKNNSIAPLLDFHGTAILDSTNTELDQQGDEYKMTHVQLVTPILEEVKDFKQMDDRNGFTKNRTMRKIATIPMLEFVKHPEWAHDKKALKRWLKSEEGKMYMTVTKGV